MCVATPQLNRSLLTKSRDTPFLKDVTHEITKTYVAPPPLTSDLPPKHVYVYQSWPKLDHSLMHPARFTNRLGTVRTISKREVTRLPCALLSVAEFARRMMY
jgi:hypothetical protein